jgi:hypothetical protein
MKHTGRPALKETNAAHSDVALPGLQGPVTVMSEYILKVIEDFDKFTGVYRNTHEDIKVGRWLPCTSCDYSSPCQALCFSNCC